MFEQGASSKKIHSVLDIENSPLSRGVLFLNNTGILCALLIKHINIKYVLTKIGFLNIRNDLLFIFENIRNDLSFIFEIVQ
jgi:hypothetical protein